MTRDVSTHAILADVKREGVLRSERMMVELSKVRRVGEVFVHCIVGVCLGDLIMRYVGNSSRGA